MTERKIVQTAVVPAGQELNFGNGVAVVNGTQDHMKVTFETLSTVESALADKIERLEEEIKELKERLTDAEKVIEKAKDLHYCSSKLERMRACKSLYRQIDEYQRIHGDPL